MFYDILYLSVNQCVLFLHVRERHKKEVKGLLREQEKFYFCQKFIVVV